MSDEEAKEAIVELDRDGSGVVCVDRLCVTAPYFHLTRV